MLIAVVLAILVIASVLFHFLNPWQATPLASNWANIDTTLAITFLVCGIFFVGIMAFMVYCLVKYRHREGNRAHYEPESKKLETILIVATSIGICAMLAPGLIAYNDFINPPEDSMEIEVLGQQWRWSFRFPGKDGVLGTSNVKNINSTNPFGVNPDDPNGQDDYLVHGNELHLPVDQPIKFILRSVDVLHNFYIPQFRAKMDLVPGVVSTFWATPTKLGNYEILCAELCGVGHFNMRGKLQAVSQPNFQSWLESHKTFAESLSGESSGGLIEQGQQLVQSNGCVACHSIDGSAGLAPTFKGLYGKTEQLSDGTTIVVDDAYITESILEPATKVVQGFPAVMIAYDFSEDQLAALIAYIRSLSDAAASDSVQQSTSNAAEGEQLAQTQGCLACHTLDGGQGVGPSWQGLANSTRKLADGSTVTANVDYIRESIANPSAKLVEGYPPAMPPYTLTDAQINALVAFIESLATEH